MRRPIRKSKRQQRGTATVEMAFLAPVFLTLTLGLAEASHMYDVQNQLSSAARDGARLAAMDRDGITPEGMSTNDKIIQDIRNMLDAAGLPGDDVVVTITEDDSDTTFDLDDPDNDYEMFKVTIELDYAEVSPGYASLTDSFSLTGSIVLRNARSSLVQ